MSDLKETIDVHLFYVFSKMIQYKPVKLNKVGKKIYKETKLGNCDFLVSSINIDHTVTLKAVGTEQHLGQVALSSIE